MESNPLPRFCRPPPGRQAPAPSLLRPSPGGPCPRQESNLVFDLRKVVCASVTPRGRSSITIRCRAPHPGIEPCLAAFRRPPCVSHTRGESTQCPCQESNLVFDLRGVACRPSHAKGSESVNDSRFVGLGNAVHKDRDAAFSCQDLGPWMRAITLEPLGNRLETSSSGWCGPFPPDIPPSYVAPAAAAQARRSHQVMSQCIPQGHRLDLEQAAHPQSVQASIRAWALTHSAVAARSL